VPQDKTQAARLFRQAAEQGFADAQINLGLCYEEGEGVPQDKAQAARLFRQAADQGNAMALYTLGVIYETGDGVPQDKAQAARLFLLATDQGFTGTPSDFGIRDKEGNGVLDHTGPASVFGVWAQRARQLRQAADQGDAVTQYVLGLCYKTGEGVPQDKAQAARLFRQAADKGDVKAQYELGVCCEHGNGVRHDTVEAVARYRLAIAGGHVGANANLGLCFEKGRGVPLDRAEAERLYQLAARSGSAHARTKACLSYLDDAIDGPPHGMAPALALDLTRNAVFELNLAARLGDSAAAEHLVSLAGRRDVTSACCVGCGALRKLKTCSKCRVARFCDTECTARMWPAHKASCKAWRRASSGQDED
jgi:TPR repeat protein